MSGSVGGYDYSAAIYSQDGRIYQIEYATKAVENAGTIIGVRCSDGIVLAVEKVTISPMLVPGSNRRIFTVDQHAGMAITGLSADGRQVVQRARDECENYRETYGHRILPNTLAKRVASYLHFFTTHGSLRPFGVSAIMGCIDQTTNTPELYCVEPNGESYRYLACVSGKGSQAAKTELERLDFDTLTVADCLRHLVNIFETIQDPSRDGDYELEVSRLCEESGWKHEHVPFDEIIALQEQSMEEEG